MQHVPLPQKGSPPTTMVAGPTVKSKSEPTAERDFGPRTGEVDTRSAVFKQAVNTAVEKILADRAQPAAILGATATSIKLGDHLYVVKVRMGDGPRAGWAFLTHTATFKKEELQAKVDEACQIVNDSRLTHRRKEMAAARTPVPDAKELNERLFPSDVDFFEVVMVDKFGFKRLLVDMTEGSIEPTVKT